MYVAFAFIVGAEILKPTFYTYSSSRGLTWFEYGSTNSIQKRKIQESEFFKIIKRDSRCFRSREPGFHLEAITVRD